MTPIVLHRRGATELQSWSCRTRWRPLPITAIRTCCKSSALTLLCRAPSLHSAPLLESGGQHKPSWWLLWASLGAYNHQLDRLAPATFDEDPVTMASLPMRGHPAGAPTRRHHPCARHPAVCAAIPTVITGSPNISTPRRRHAALM